MVNRFYVILLVAIRLRSIVTILDQNHYRNLSQQEKLVPQATFSVIDIKNNNICQRFYNIQVIIYYILVSIAATNAIDTSNKCLHSQIKKLSNKKVSPWSSPIMGF